MLNKHFHQLDCALIELKEGLLEPNSVFEKEIR